MMQQSVYTKLALNNTVVNAQLERIRKNKPAEGLVEILTITEKQFARIEYVVGKKQQEVIDSDARLVII